MRIIEIIHNADEHIGKIKQRAEAGISEQRLKWRYRLSSRISRRRTAWRSRINIARAGNHQEASNQ